MINIREFFWPLLEKANPIEIKNLTIDDLKLDDENVDKALEYSFKIYESELSRSSTIETKSSLFIGTLAVITSVVLAITTILISRNEFSFILFLLVLALFLMIIYMIRTIWFAIKVLERKGFHTFYSSDIFRMEKKGDYDKHLIVTLSNKIKRNSVIINSKVDNMVMAQEYFKRAIGALTIYSLLIFLFLIDKNLSLLKLFLQSVVELINSTTFGSGLIIVLVLVSTCSLIINLFLLNKLSKKQQ